MAKKEPTKPLKIIHRMADGTIRDSIEGMEVPFTPETYGAYKVVAECADLEAMKKLRKEEPA